MATLAASAQALVALAAAAQYDGLQLDFEGLLPSSKVGPPSPRHLPAISPSSPSPPPSPSALHLPSICPPSALHLPSICPPSALHPPSQPGYEAFVEAAHSAARDRGLGLQVTLYAPHLLMHLTAPDAYNVTRLASISDGVFVMGYDMSW